MSTGIKCKKISAEETTGTKEKREIKSNEQTN